MGASFFDLSGSQASCRRLLAAVALVGLVLGCVDCATAGFDWGSWNSTGTGTYLNGDTITISLGPKTGFFNNSFSSNAVGGPVDQPSLGGQYSHFANLIADSRPLPTWTVTIDLSNYNISSQTVFAFANLGAGLGGGIQTARIDFRDSLSNSLSLTSATVLGSFDHQWAGATFNDPASFNLSTKIWSYTPNSLGVEGASEIFFLTNLPTKAASIQFTVFNPSDLASYQGDSIFFAVGSPIEVPEPSAMLIYGVGLGCVAAGRNLRRSRKSSL